MKNVTHTDERPATNGNGQENDINPALPRVDNTLKPHEVREITTLISDILEPKESDQTTH